MKVVVLAHVPPPHHGQSYMTQLMIEGFQNQSPPTLYHVNARFSATLSDIGTMQWLKAFKIILYILQALWLRFRYHADILYYIPAPPSKSPIIRDWIFMATLRPFFRHLVLHHRAMGLGLWAQQQAHNSGLKACAAKLTQQLLSKASLSLILTEASHEDAAYFQPKLITHVPNGRPDPCQDFETAILPERESRLQQRIQISNEQRTPVATNPACAGEGGKNQEPGTEQASQIFYFRCLFLAHCTEEKGIFDAIEAVALVNQKLKTKNQALQVVLDVAGQFLSRDERQRFEDRIQEPDLIIPTEPSSCAVHYVGFANYEKKIELLSDADCMLFPTYYRGEAMPGVILEALAFGLPVVTTNWRCVDQLLPTGARFSAPIQSPEMLAEQILQLLDFTHFLSLRNHFKTNYSREMFLQRMREAFLSISHSDD